MLDKIKWLYRYYKKHPWVMFILIFLTPVQAIFQVSIPRMIDFTIDYLDTEKVPNDWLASIFVALSDWLNVSPAVGFGLGFVILGFIASVLYFIVQSRRAWMNLRLEWHFRQDAFDGITDKGPDFFNKFRTGDLVTRMTDDVAEKLSWFACSGIFRTYEALLMIVFTISMMMLIDPMLTLYAAGPLPILIFIFFKTSSMLDKRYDHLQSRISKFNDIMEACFSGIRVVKAYVREKAQKEVFEDAAVDRKEAEVDAIKLQTVIDSLYMYIWQFSILIILVVGGYFVMQADLSKGKLASFVFYTVWLVFPMFDIGQFLVKSRQSAVSMNRLQELEDVLPMVSDRESSGNKNHDSKDIGFDKVSFGFDGANAEIIKKLSLKVQGGQTIALVGKVGSGKSWLVNMIPRLVDPTGGMIEYNGHDLKKYKLEDLRQNIGYVPQEPVLFSDSIRNNILMGRENIDEDLIDWAIDVSQFKADIESFPKKLDTFVGTRGMSISGGQKQRLGLARALVGRPEILILDDCTSALDSKTESALWDRLHEVLPDLTALIITHRPDTLEKADSIIVIEEGQMIEQGHHVELINSSGTYARIYKKYQLEEAVK